MFIRCSKCSLNVLTNYYLLLIPILFKGYLLSFQLEKPKTKQQTNKKTIGNYRYTHVHWCVCVCVRGAEGACRSFKTYERNITSIHVWTCKMPSFNCFVAKLKPDPVHLKTSPRDSRSLINIWHTRDGNMVSVGVFPCKIWCEVSLMWTTRCRSRSWQ